MEKYKCFFFVWGGGVIHKYFVNIYKNYISISFNILSEIKTVNVDYKKNSVSYLWSDI